MGCSGSKVSEVGDKTKVIFVIGGPGCGKGIQCEKLGEEFNYVHMPIRDVLKSIVLHNMGDDWETLLNDIKEKKSISSEKLVSYIKLVLTNLKSKKVILDGFPRNFSHLEEWVKSMSEITILIGVIYFEATHEMMKNKLIEMEEEEEDEEEEEEEEEEDEDDKNKKKKKGKKEKKKEEKKENIDDIVNKKIDQFNKDIKPILHACENQGNIIKIDASLSAVDVYFELKNAFKEKKWHKL